MFKRMKNDPKKREWDLILKGYLHCHFLMFSSHILSYTSNMDTFCQWKAYHSKIEALKVRFGFPVDWRCNRTKCRHFLIVDPDV